MSWTYKTLSIDGDAAVWTPAKMEFATPEDATTAAAALMLSAAYRGHMIVISLEPLREQKPISQRFAEREELLDAVKRIFTAYDNIEKRTDAVGDLRELLLRIDPDFAIWSKRHHVEK